MRQRAPGEDAGLSLSWLLDPLPVEVFLGESWGNDHRHISHGRADYFEALLPGEATLDALLELFRHQPSAVRLVRGPDKKPADIHRLANGSLDIASVRTDFEDGYTVAIDGVDQYVRTIGTLARSLEVELNYPTQVNTYITPPHSSGLVPHYDDHDVFIVQIQGSKTWHLYPRDDRPPREIQREGDKAVALESLSASTSLLLKSGDLLYVPRGRVHAAQTQADTSAHLTVGIHAPTVLTLAIGALYAQSFRDDRLNAQLPVRHLDDDGLDPAVGDLLRGAIAGVDDAHALAGGVDLLADALVRRGQCPPIGKIFAANTIGVQTWVVRHQPLFARVKTGRDGVTLQFASLSVDAGADHEAALRFVSRSSAPFQVGDLPGLAPGQQTDLVRTLLVSGFLTRLPDPENS